MFNGKKKNNSKKWNVVATVRDFRRACHELSAFGRVQRTDFYNTLLMHVEDVPGMLEALRQKSLEDPGSLDYLSRLVPVTRSFVFRSAGDFEDKSYRLAHAWIGRLGKKGFYVRIHRRGFKEEISSIETEQFLDDMLIEDLRMADAPGHITFEDPDAVIAVETIRNWAGVSLLTREQMQKYPFIRVN